MHNEKFSEEEDSELTNSIPLQNFFSILVVDIESGEIVSASKNIALAGLDIPLKIKCSFKSIFPNAGNLKQYFPQSSFKIVDLENIQKKRLRSLITLNNHYLYFHFENKAIDLDSGESFFFNLPELINGFRKFNNETLLNNEFLEIVSEILPDKQLSLFKLEENNKGVLISEKGSLEIGFKEKGMPLLLTEDCWKIFSNENPYIVYDLKLPASSLEVLEGININSNAIINKINHQIDSALQFSFELRSIIYFPIFVNEHIWGILIAAGNLPYALSFQKIVVLKCIIQAFSAQKIAINKEAEYLRNDNFKLLLQNSSDILTILNEDFSVKYISDTIESVLGYHFETFEGDWFEILHPQDKEKFFRFLEEIKSAKNQKHTLEYRAKNSKGNYIFLETIGKNLLNNPKINGILCNSRDITQKVKAHRRLSKFQKIIEFTRSGIIIIDHNRRDFPMVYVNEGIYNLTQKNAMEFVGRSWDLLNEFIIKNENYDIYRQSVIEARPLEITLRMKDLDKKKMWVRAQLIPFINEISNVVIILSNISSEIEIHEKLREYSDKLHTSNEELQTFAYVASHDLQEPLRTIAGFSELLAEVYKDKIDEEGKEYLDFILDATDRMKKLISDLLQFSRLSTAKDFIVEIRVESIFAKAIENLKTLIEENDAVITHDKFPILFVNESLLLQIFQNLISNSIKYKSNLPPKVHIHVNRIEKEWVFGVEDNGIGIEEKYFDRIFIIFQRLHTTDKYSGTGMGLAICKKIIEKYGGKIWVESEINRGSVFYFTIPDIV